jgi:hypothetical protein
MSTPPGGILPHTSPHVLPMSRIRITHSQNTPTRPRAAHSGPQWPTGFASVPQEEGPHGKAPLYSAALLPLRPSAAQWRPTGAVAGPRPAPSRGPASSLALPTTLSKAGPCGIIGVDNPYGEGGPCSGTRLGVVSPCCGGCTCLGQPLGLAASSILHTEASKSGAREGGWS